MRLDLRSSRVIILSNISAGTGSVLIRCRPKGICRDAAFRMMVHKIFSPFWQFVGIFLSFSQFILYLLTISVPVCFLQGEVGTMGYGVDNEVHLQTNEVW